MLPAPLYVREIHHEARKPFIQDYLLQDLKREVLGSQLSGQEHCRLARRRGLPMQEG